MRHENILFIASIIFFIFLLSGCVTDNNKNIIDRSKIITLLSDIQKFLVDTVYFKNYRIAFLETNDNSLLRKITRIYSDDNKLFVLDKSLNKVVIFDMNGNYLTHIHKAGNGPSEYLSLMDLCLDTDQKQLILLCGQPNKIMKFNYVGEFIKEQTVSDLYFNILSNSGFIYGNKLEINTNNQDEFELTCFDTDMKLMHSFLPMRKNITHNILFPGQTLTSTLHDYYTRRYLTMLHY